MMKHIHMIGIGGAGLSAIAQVLLEQGFIVSGSDRVESPAIKILAEEGIQVFIGHDPQHIKGADIVIRSSAIPDNNPEVLAAVEMGIPVLKRREFLRTLTEGKRTIAIAGSHGKTSTTAMITYALHNLGLDPSFISGGVITQLSTNAHSGTDSFFVIEADEYDYMFLSLTPEIAIITNIEHDHPDCFPTPADYRDAFEAFVKQVKPSGTVLMCIDDPETKALKEGLSADRFNIFGYGASPEANYFADSIQLINGYYQFDFVFKNINEPSEKLGTVRLNIPGYHSVLNATAALGAIHQLKLSIPEAIKSIENFTGANRRFSILGVFNGITIIDDYGHHPSEIKATLEAAHSRYPHHRVWAVWQPHTYSRTQNLEKRFIQSLNLADKVLVLRIFGAREMNDSYSARVISSALPEQKAEYADNFTQAKKYLFDNLSSNDVVIFFSAGDATQLSQMILEDLSQREKRS